MAALKHWSKMQERGTFIGMQVLLFVYRLFGRKILSFVLFPVVVYLYFSGGASKKASLEYWQRVSKIMGTPKKIDYRIGIRHFYAFAQSAFDKIDAWLGKIKKEDILYGEEHPFMSLQREQKGAVFIGSHLGNLEVCRALGAGRYNTKINVLVFTHHAVEFNKIMQRINPASNVDLIQATHVGPDLAILLKEKIDKGEMLVIAGDRTSANSTGRVVYCDFLGEPAPFSQGPFILASILNCPVYYLFCLKQGQQYRVIFEHVAESLKFSRSTRQQELTNVINLYAQRLEHYCLKYPLQWFNFFNFWQNDNEVIRNMENDVSTNNKMEK